MTGSEYFGSLIIENNAKRNQHDSKYPNFTCCVQLIIYKIIKENNNLINKK